MKDLPFLLVIGGPTGSGKTALAIELYLRYGWPIISADSRQIYRYLDIGTNKVSQEIQAYVPHHLIDICWPDEAFSAGAFVHAVEELLSRWRIPVVQIVGGTGFYAQALLYGLAAVPPTPPSVREKVTIWLAQEGLATLQAWLRSHDPLTASQIDLANPRRVQRAVEVLLTTGKPWVSFWEKPSQRRHPAWVVTLAPPREILRQRIIRRTHEQVTAGWLEETRYILEKGYSPTCPALQTLGYKECLEVLQGKRAAHTLTEAIVQANWRYARRQLTWWRHHSPDQWVESVDPQALATRLSELIHAQLNKSPT